MKLIHISEGLRMFKRKRRVSKEGIKQWKGNPHDICVDIVDNCWNGKYFMVSSGHFCCFYMRDLGWCAGALVNMGFRRKLLLSLEYALKKYQKHGRVTTSISPKGKCFDFPHYGEDTLPFLIHSLRLTKADELVEKYKWFLKQETEYYFNNVFDKKLGLIDPNKTFSSMKDYSKRKSSTYGNCLLAMMREDLEDLKLFNPFKKYDIKKNIEKELWNGEYFYDDLNKEEVVCGDANVFPFWTGVFTSKEWFGSCLAAMQEKELDKPFPLKYANEPRKMIGIHAFSGGYEKHAVWSHIGLCLLDVLKRFKHEDFKRYLSQYAYLIRKHKNFLEVYEADGSIFKTPFYHADENMLWASKYLDLTKND